MKRLCIYFFYDPEGIVDDYVTDCISSMKEHCERLIVVCNGRLTIEGRRTLLDNGADNVYKRQNVGFDVWAYKCVIEKLGWARLRTYDEVIFMNFTIIGPVYPLSEMFSVMDKKINLDFWGLTVHHGESYDPWGTMPEGYIPEHLQSHFIVVRNKLLNSRDLENYWSEMRPINTYQEAIGYHEAIFTNTFSRKGYTWGSYIDTKDLTKLTSYPLMFMPREVIGNRRCPFFKRKAFFLPIEEYLGCSSGDAPAQTLDLLNSVGYDTRKIFQNINRSENQYDLRVTTNQFFLLHDKQSDAVNYQPRIRTCAVLAQVDCADAARLLLEHVPSIASAVNKIYVIASRELAKNSLVKRLGHYQNVEVKVGGYIEYFEAAKKIADSYDYIGLIGSYYPREDSYNLLRYEFLKYHYDSLFRTRSAIASALDILASRPHLGALFTASHPSFGSEIWSMWSGKTFGLVKKVVRRHGYGVRIESNKPPMASQGGFCWVKAAVIKSIDENILINACTSKLTPDVYFNILPFFAQSLGMISASVLSENVSGSYLASQQKKVNTLANTNSPTPQHVPRISQLYWKAGSFYSEARKYTEYFPDGTTEYKVHFKITASCDSFRFDPIEGGGVICKNIKAWHNELPITIRPLNHTIRFGDTDIFVSNDPQYEILVSAKKGDVLTVSCDKLTVFSHNDFSNTLVGSFGEPIAEILKDMQLHYTTDAQSKWYSPMTKTRRK